MTDNPTREEQADQERQAELFLAMLSYLDGQQRFDLMVFMRWLQFVAAIRRWWQKVKDWYALYIYSD